MSLSRITRRAAGHAFERGPDASAVFSPVVVLAILIGLSGCTDASETDPQPAEGTSSSSPDPLATASPAPVAQPPVDADVTADERAVAEASGIAARVMAAFCRPSLDYETWIGDLYPFLSQAAGTAYGTVDPANVPCTSITGEAVVRDGDDPYTVGVVVPTDAGEYAVYVHRVGVDAQWAVEQITPVSGE